MSKVTSSGPWFSAIHATFRYRATNWHSDYLSFFIPSCMIGTKYELILRHGTDFTLKSKYDQASLMHKVEVHP